MIGWQEILVILLVLLIIVGPKKLPELARAIGKAIREVSSAKNELEKTIREEILRENEKAG